MTKSDVRRASSVSYLLRACPYAMNWLCLFVYNGVNMQEKRAALVYTLYHITTNIDTHQQTTTS